MCVSTIRDDGSEMRGCVLEDICSHVTVFSGSGSGDMLAACTWVWPGWERRREEGLERENWTRGNVPHAYQYHN